MTRSKPLSKRKDFQGAIVVSAEWSNMAGDGTTELGLLARKRSLELWSWLDEYGAERIDAGDLKDWRGAVEFLVNSDAGLAAINPFEASISGEPRY
jgi:hypothetical protein